MRYEQVKRELRHCNCCKKTASHVVAHDRMICMHCGNVTLTKITARKEVIPTAVATECHDQ